MTALGSLLVGLPLSKNKKAPSRPSSRKYSAIVVEMVLFPLPARPYSQIKIWPSATAVSQPVMNLSISSRVPGRHSSRAEPSIRTGFSCLRFSILTENNQSHEHQTDALRTE